MILPLFRDFIDNANVIENEAHFVLECRLLYNLLEICFFPYFKKYYAFSSVSSSLITKVNISLYLAEVIRLRYYRELTFVGHNYVLASWTLKSF
jgi:hypothetical protein